MFHRIKYNVTISVARTYYVNFDRMRLTVPCLTIDMKLDADRSSEAFGVFACECYRVGSFFKHVAAFVGRCGCHSDATNKWMTNGIIYCDSVGNGGIVSLYCNSSMSKYTTMVCCIILFMISKQML